MQPFFSTKKLTRYNASSPTKEFLDELVETYDLHEIIEEDILESTVQDKIDVYDKCLFLVLHFPKFEPSSGKYNSNEFNLILGKEWMATLTRYETKRIPKIKDAYAKQLEDLEKEDEFKISPYYVLYELLDEMYDKVLLGLRYFSKDLRGIEDTVFDRGSMNKHVLEEIMIKRRNIVSLKHMMKPQDEILHELQNDTDIKRFWGDELDVYFEDLESKLDRIMGQITIVSEDIDSLYDTYNALVNMKLNSIITLLTIFTAIMGVLTLVTGFYGMNIQLPGAEDPLMLWRVIGGMVILSGLLFLIFRWKKWL